MVSERMVGEEFAFEPLSLEKREAGAIPYGFALEGEDDVILIGDAAGFCNALSGEGIRLAIESGISASDAVREAILTGKPAAVTYAKHVSWINSFVKQIHRFAVGLNDADREEFVRSELARTVLK